MREADQAGRTEDAASAGAARGCGGGRPDAGDDPGREDQSDCGGSGFRPGGMMNSSMSASRATSASMNWS